MPVANSDSVPAEMFPGVASGAEGTGAPGSASSGGHPADSVPASVTIPGMSYSQMHVPTHGTVVSSQVDTFDGATGEGISSAGPYPAWREPYAHPGAGS